MRYEPLTVESKWQKVWAEQKTFQVSSDIEVLKKKPKYYILDMFPYPSGAGLHVGHPEGYTATDVIARLKRMQGFNVMHPMGWDAFGLPAERAAIREDIHPAIITKRNITNFKRQIQRLGFGYDWDREINTTDPKYYKWTQWIFLQLFNRGLAYLAEVPVNWCPALGTVLANEEVKDGKYVETGDVVEKKLMKQWMLRITSYADRLLEDLDDLDWPENVKEMQRNWIGKSIGAEIFFSVEGSQKSIRIFTTRADTIFGATYCVLAPEHPLIAEICTEDCRAGMDSYLQEVGSRSDLERQEQTQKTGVPTGAFAVNPLTKELIPIWVADYVIGSYGSGAVMAVPAHDQRDCDFALKYSLPRVRVVDGSAQEEISQAFEGSGTMVNSGFLDGLSTKDAIGAMCVYLEKNKLGVKKIQYRLRDWLFSRQRYWGEPVPVVYGADGRVEALPEDAIPVELPMMSSFAPAADGQPPLANAPKEWLATQLLDGTPAQREINTMPQWAGSCWYYLRYLDPDNDNRLCGTELEKYWMPVDLYIGGIEHAVLHLLYARFWHKVLFDCGVVHTKEPFQKLFNQGMILGQSFQDQAGKYYYPEEVEQKGTDYFTKNTGRPLKNQIEKMSKSRFNVISPDEVIDQFGADSMRLYEMFMGPLEQVKMWQMSGVEGVYRFLCRVWRLVVDEQTGEVSAKLVDAPLESSPDLLRMLHRTIKKVGEDTQGLHFNTAISQMMQFVNDATKMAEIPRNIVLEFLKLLSPYAPHIAEELWSKLAQQGLIVDQPWPDHDEALCQESQVTVVVQVNGKRRADVLVAMDESEQVVRALAEEQPYVKAQLAGNSVKRVVFVKNRLMNFVIG